MYSRSVRYLHFKKLNLEKVSYSAEVLGNTSKGNCETSTILTFKDKYSNVFPIY
jgi:hypothetical protein